MSLKTTNLILDSLGCNSKPSWNLSNGYDFLKGTRKKRRWLEGDDVTIPTHQWDETQKVRSFVEGIFQGSNGGGTQKIGNIHDRKQEKRTGPSRAESKLL